MKERELLNHPFLKKYFNKKYTITEISGGNLNYIFLAQAKGCESVIIKYTPPYIKCLGEDYRLTQTRLEYEINALKKVNCIVPSLSPKIYYSDNENHLLFMEYLDGYEILREAHLNGKRFDFLADKLSTFVANTLFANSVFNLSSIEKDTLELQFNNIQMRNISEDYIFTFPFQSHPTNRYNPENSNLSLNLFNDIVFQENVAQLKYTFSTHKEALLHGDLHTGSILINQNNLVIIDMEFAFMGPIAFDIGSLIANFLLAYSSSHIKGENANWLLELIINFWIGFENKFLELWGNKSSPLVKINFIKTLFNDTLGFAGCEIARRILGAAGVAEISYISNNIMRSKAEEFALSVAKIIVKERHLINNITQLTNIIKNI